MSFIFSFLLSEKISFNNFPISNLDFSDKDIKSIIIANEKF